jgi:putative transcriptional regulator
MDKKKLNDVERDLLEGMEWVVEKLKGDKPLTARRLELKLGTPEFTAEEVKATRKLLKLSQAMFAQFLGVARKSVCAWEGGRTPPTYACRFMDEIRRNPRPFQQHVREAIQVKSEDAPRREDRRGGQKRESTRSRPSITSKGH